MKFYDAHLTYGVPVNVDSIGYKPCHTIAGIDEELDRTGVTGGLVYSIAADMSGVCIGNRFLAEDLKKCSHDLYGVYSLVPRFTHEIPSAADLPAILKKDRMGAVRIAPRIHNFLPKAGVLSDYLEMCIECHIPLVLDNTVGIELGEMYDMLERYPELPVILSYMNIWPADRYYRPFLAQFPNLYMELSSMITDQGIEKLVNEYGPERLLFGSRFPQMYVGGQQLMLRHARISEEAKDLIAGGNFLRLMGEAKA